LPQEKEIDWSKPIEVVWRTNEQGEGIVGMRGRPPKRTRTFTLLKREDDGLRIIVYINPKRFTEKGRYSLPPEVWFSFDLAFLEFMFSNPKFTNGKTGWTPGQLGAWQEANDNYDKRLVDGTTPETARNSYLTVFK